MRAKKVRQISAIVEAPGEVQKGYLAKWLVVCTFPHREPKEEKYTRINGDYTLNIQSGMDKRGNYLGLPYGAPVRLLLFWIITEANRLKWTGDTSRRIHLGESMSRFVQLVGYDPDTGRGKRGDATRLRDMMKRLFGCRISFIRSETVSEATGYSWLNMDVAPKGELWWDVKNPDQASLFDSWIELGEDFYNAVTTNPVPFDFRAMCALKHSPMAIDLYAWLTWRVHAMKEGGSASIPLHGPKGIAAQIGSNYSRTDDFKRAVAEGLEAVKLVWPKLDCELSASRLMVRKSPVPIADIPPVKKRRSFGQVKPDELSVDTVIEFRKANPRINPNTVWKAYRAFLKREEITPRDIDAHFKDYAAKWVRGEL
jgi:hypothetical protein